MSDRSVYITRLGAFLPNEPVGNDDMEAILGQIGERPSRARRTVLRSNGIKQRYYAIDPATGEHNYSNASMTAAAINQLEDEHFQLPQLDCLVCGTSLPDQLLPNHAVMVHGELDNSPNCEVAATAGVCISGVTALRYAFMAIKAGIHQTAIASGSEIVSANMKAHNFKAESDQAVAELKKRPEIAFDKDFLRWMLSDGAGAALLESQPRKQQLALRVDWLDLFSYANEMEACMYAGGVKQADGSIKGWALHNQQELANESVMAVKQDIKLLNENIVHYTIEKPLLALREKYQLQAEDFDFFLPHYSSGFFRDKVSEGLCNAGMEIPQERWFTNLSHCGNTGSASIFIMLEELFRSGKIHPGNKLLCYVPESGRFSSAFFQLTAVLVE